MPEKKQIKALICKKTGTMKIECNNFIGEECSSIENIEAQLGTILKKEDKEERYQYELHTPATVGVV